MSRYFLILFFSGVRIYIYIYIYIHTMDILLVVVLVASGLGWYTTSRLCRCWRPGGAPFIFCSSSSIETLFL